MGLILLSGFEPFGGEKINPSWEAVKKFKETMINGYKVEVFQLPVSFIKAREIIYEKLTKVEPDFFITLGQAGGVTKLHIETIALNVMYSKKPDNEKFIPKGQAIFDNAPLAYRINLNAELLVEKLLQAGIPAKISFHAGTYVCNLVLYTSLHAIHKEKLRTKTAFIHVPYIFQQILNKDRPAFPLEYIEKGVRVILETITKI